MAAIEQDDSIDIEVHPMLPTSMFNQEAWITDLSSRITDEVKAQLGGGDEPPPSPPPKTFMGETKKGWAAWLLKGAVAVGAAVATSWFTWYSHVNASINNRPTYEEATKMAVETIEAHEDHGSHAKMEALLSGQAKQIKQLSDLQIRQTVILEAHDKGIEKAAAAIERHRNRDH